jgi:tetratricopeptide (TPR) repeat protein
MAEAVGCYDDAIAIYRRLVEGEGRAELANYLALALMNKALMLEQMERNEEALACYDDSIRWWEGCLHGGVTHVLPDLLRTIRFQMMTLLDLRQWTLAAASAAWALDHAAPSLQDDSLSEAVAQELGEMLGCLRQLPNDDREYVLLALGAWEAEVRSLLEE